MISFQRNFQTFGNFPSWFIGLILEQKETNFPIATKVRHTSTEFSSIYLNTNFNYRKIDERNYSKMGKN